MSEPQRQDPLQGVTLEQIVTSLFEHYGWGELSRRIAIKCFTINPSVRSSLSFLRKTPWARKKVENLFLFTQRRAKKSPETAETNF